MKKVTKYQDNEGGLHDSQKECEEADDIIAVQKLMNDHAGMDSSFYLDDFLNHLKRNNDDRVVVMRVIERCGRS